MLEVNISNADRVIFPDDGITKGEVCAYFANVAETMFPFVEGRALTVERYPKGISDKGFMQKNAPSHFGDDLIERVTVPKEDGGTTSYPVLLNPASIVAYANLGVLTFHVPPVRVDSGWLPDWIIWDLDPSEGDVTKVREAAWALLSVLNSFGIPALPLASGSKGYHLRTQMVPGATLEETAQLARGVSALAVASHPDLLTLAFRKAEREDKVFVDWLRNAALSTAVAPWSLRPRRGAPVAVPIAWNEIDDIDPDGFTLRTALPRLDAEPWAAQEAVDLSSTVAAVGAAVEEAGIVLEPFDRFRS